MIITSYSFNGAPLNFDKETLKKLRHDYLHWNSSYGDIRDSWGTYISGKNKPNIVNGKRKRDVY